VNAERVIGLAGSDKPVMLCPHFAI